MLWSFQVLGKDSMDCGIRSGKSLSLGMPKAPQGNIQAKTKSLSLGMPRKASPLSSSFIDNFTWSYIFIHHMICVLLGVSIILLGFPLCYLEKKIASFISIKVALIALLCLFCKYTCCCLKTESLPLLQKFPRKVRML